HITEQYLSDYTATWRAGMDNLNVRDYETMPALTDALEQIISGDQPFLRALTALRDDTHALTLSGKLDDKAKEAAINEMDYRLLSRLGHE
ncbi:ImcF-related family protein, partial [Escherichia coli]|uniref:ImcF-related family protein n=1 Tax=Escherichia coli TaxID=562 RepID=UPI001EDADA3B